MHYVTRKSHSMEKHKFVVTCHDVHFMETAMGPPEYTKRASTFHGLDTMEFTM
jgi:hypothetical protein